MECAEMTSVERVATLLEGIETGHVTVVDLASIGAEIVDVLADLAAAPAGWVADLGQMLSEPAPDLHVDEATATPERSSNL